MFLIVGSIIAFLSLYPTYFLFYGSLTDAPLGVPGHFTLQNYIRAYSDPEAYSLLLNSFIFGIGASGLSIVFALALAWITIRTDAPWRRLFELIAIIPNILPPILVSISWVMLLNPSNGLINGLFVKLFGMEKGPFNIYTMAGLIFVEGLILTPLAFLIVAAAMKSMDPSLEESAKTLGFRRIRRHAPDYIPIDTAGHSRRWNAEFRPRHRKLRHPGYHRPASAHRSVHDEDLARSAGLVSDQS